jgi:hypothetical protein
MDEHELVVALRDLMHREQELYKKYMLLVDATDDLELKEIFGHHAFEGFTHLNAIMERYKEMVDDLRKRGLV